MAIEPPVVSTEPTNIPMSVTSAWAISEADSRGVPRVQSQAPRE